MANCEWIRENKEMCSRIAHAFDDAILNASMEESEKEAYSTYRRILDLHFEIYLEEFDDEDLFWSLVDYVAESMDQTENLKKVMYNPSPVG
jgi:hypothetical protein